ncbi:MAG: PBP1A family penicillin-binding protein [Sporomusaceae bacterium]|nr:PBP1A family penicillin-binding protein [Sporomusaceae bacterium]
MADLVKYQGIRFLFGLFLTLFLLLFGGLAYAFFTLPQTDNLENMQFMNATQVFDVNGRLISKLFEENRVVVPIRSMSYELQRAVIDNEDSRFFSHGGVDPIGLARALWVDIRMGTLAEGGSTITQQLAKNMFLTQEKTVIRKLKEVLLALILEQRFSKQEILQAYLNQVYFGEGAYGVEAAAQVYFGKHAGELTLGESALLAGLPRGPNIYSPYSDLSAALSRRAEILSGMVKIGDISPEQAAAANAEPLQLIGKKRREVQASYFLDYIANELVGRYGANRVYRGGLKVFTTLDIKTQKAAEKVLTKQQGAVLTLDPKTGAIRAMVGGKNYEESQLNRVITETRQPGSAFKPFLYAAALQTGLTANAVILDEAVNFNGYQPQNYDKKYRGPVTMSKALRDSINIPAVKVAQQIGIDKALALAKAAGITTIRPEDNNLAAALGGLTQGVNLIELASAYTIFANGGVYSKPIAILKVLDEHDQVLEETTLMQQSVLSPEIAYIMTKMMTGVLETGTGTAGNIGRSAAGKTGTTDQYEAAWFIGYTPDLLTGIYIGNDDRTSVGLSGSQVAGLWGAMMNSVLKDQPPAFFPVPANITDNIPICANSGRVPILGCPEVEKSAFIKGTEPFLGKLMQENPSGAGANGDGGNQADKDKNDRESSKSKWRIPWLQLPGFL